jgi:hypothetical protein
MRKILSIDGGGIKGIFPASFLATVEDSVGEPISEYFDLIVGTSTGGILALALGLGLASKDILRFYETFCPIIFSGNRFTQGLAQLGVSKYSPEPLRKALGHIFGAHTLADSGKRLVIPSFDLETGEVHVWKTPHHPKLERDYKATIIDVALSTAAAPTYFPTHRNASGTPLVDGGIWANNPTVVALVEAIGILGWPREELRVLSLGCTSTPLNVDWGRSFGLGKLYWGTKIAHMLIGAQVSSANGMGLHLIGDRSNMVRISPVVSNRFELDSVSEIPSLKGLGATEARKALPGIRPLFFQDKVLNDYVPMVPKGGR